MIKEFSSNFCPTGQYRFPFRFKIPFWVPPSFIHTELGLMLFTISYTLEAFLVENVPDSPFDKQRVLKTKVFLKVVQPPLCISMPKSIQLGKELKGLFLQSKGESKIELKLDKFYYKQGESILLSLLVDNRESGKTIKQVKLKLLKCIKGIESHRNRNITRYNILYREAHNDTIGKGALVEKRFVVPLQCGEIVNGTLPGLQSEQIT